MLCSCQHGANWSFAYWNFFWKFFQIFSSVAGWIRRCGTCGYEEPTVLHFFISGAESQSQSTAESQWEVQGGSSGQS